MPTRQLTIASLDEWRAAVSDSFVPLHTEAAPGPFRGLITSAGSGGVQISTIDADPHRAVRTPALARTSDGPFYKVSLQLSGAQRISQDDHEAVLLPGDLSIYDSSRPYALASIEPFRSLVLMFPRELLPLPEGVVTALTGTRLSGSSGVARLVGRMLAPVADDLDPIGTSAGGRMARTAIDLIATAMTEQLTETHDRGHTGHEHRTLALRVRAYIDAHLADPDLGPEMIAAAHFISLRHLQKVFKAEGETVTGRIRTRRLHRCAADLTNPAFASQPVSSIGARWGFPDAAHFSRVFKACHGVSPVEYRSRWRDA